MKSSWARTGWISSPPTTDTGMIGLSYLWKSNEFYGHAYAIPAVALYLAYRNRRQIRDAMGRLQPPLWGPVVALVAGTFEVLAVIGDVGFAAGVGIPFVLGATAYAIGGLPLLRPLLLPLVFLALMIPPPRVLIYEALFRLKLLVTNVAVGI